MQNYFKNLSQQIFKLIQSNEELSLFLHSEDSLFIRFNHTLVRQNTNVSQHEITLIYQSNCRTLKLTTLLTLDQLTDFSRLNDLLGLARLQAPLLDENPHTVPMQNHGQTCTVKKFNRPNDELIPELVAKTFQGQDLVGLWCSGPLIQASANSHGQFHYYECDSYFFDYSLYHNEKAVKSFYSAQNWDESDFVAHAQQEINKLNLMKKTAMTISKGSYKTYLEPAALAEILGTMSWGSLSYANYKQGRSPLTSLAEGTASFAEEFHLLENFEHGYTPSFNLLGEVSHPEIALIENGQLKNFLVSSNSAKEYGLTSNAAAPSEHSRSLEIKPGRLKESEVLKKLGTGLYLSNLHYINYSDIVNARITGMTRFACFWVENGEIQAPIHDLRFDDSLYSILGSKLIALTDRQEFYMNTTTYLKRYPGAIVVPGALISEMTFTL